MNNIIQLMRKTKSSPTVQMKLVVLMVHDFVNQDVRQKSQHCFKGSTLAGLCFHSTPSHSDRFCYDLVQASDLYRLFENWFDFVQTSVGYLTLMVQFRICHTLGQEAAQFRNSPRCTYVLVSIEQQGRNNIFSDHLLVH